MTRFSRKILKISTYRNQEMLKNEFIDMELPWKRRRLTDIWHWPHIFWLNIFGFWSEDASTPTARRWLARLRAVVLIHVGLMSASMMVAIGEKFATGDIMTNMFTVFASGPGIVGMFKIVHIIIHQKELKSAMTGLDGMLKEVDCPEAEAIMRDGLNKCWKVFTISLTSGSCITFHWLSRPLLLAAFYQDRTRIVDTWPAFIDSWAQFALSYAFQCPGVICLGHAFYIFDNIYFCIAQCILSHLDILKYKLEHLKLEGREKKSAGLVSCVKYHTNILRVCKKLRDASSAVILWQCINTVIMSCSGVFIITMSEVNANVLMNLGEIMLVITISLYFYCWYSNEITLQCEELMKSVYMSDWADATASSKKALHIMMARTIPPVYFGGILEIRLNTFTSVLKTTFSYYNFLIAVNGNSMDD